MIEVWAFAFALIFFNVILLAIGVSLLYLLIIKIGKVTKMGLENKQQKVLLAIAILAKLLLTVLFPQQRYEQDVLHVYYGFPASFFSMWELDANIHRISQSPLLPLPFEFTYDPLQMLFNILVIYFFILLFYKLYSKIFLPKSSQQS